MNLGQGACTDVVPTGIRPDGELRRRAVSVEGKKQAAVDLQRSWAGKRQTEIRFAWCPAEARLLVDAASDALDDFRAPAECRANAAPHSGRRGLLLRNSYDAGSPRASLLIPSQCRPALSRIGTIACVPSGSLTSGANGQPLPHTRQQKHKIRLKMIGPVANDIPPGNSPAFMGMPDVHHRIVR